MEIAKTIKQHRAELGWSQEVLAEKAYVSRQTVSNWETEKSYPDVHSLLILSDLFGVSLDELIKGDVAVMKEQVKSKDVRTFKKLQLMHFKCAVGDFNKAFHLFLLSSLVLKNLRVLHCDF